MKISIAMTYYNRKEQLLRTLKSISFFKESLHEIVIVDDASEEGMKIDFLDQFDFKIRLIEIKPQEKTYANACMPFNKALRACEGDAIIIQNSECYHGADVLEHVKHHLKANKYLSFACYSLGTMETHNLPDFSQKSKEEFLEFNQKFLSSLPHRTCDSFGDENSWYNHAHHRPCDLHFTSAITREDLEDLNYFDERYAPCVAFDDNEFIARIRRKNMEIERVSPNPLNSNPVPWTFHQKHHSTNYFRGHSCEELYLNTTLKEPG